MLSHCSIVAREYNIPAVVAVKDAMNIKDETRVAVDGYKGEILILKSSDH
jgi:phosphoenolpyruvate-protein kinase (PTS system EI component)